VRFGIVGCGDFARRYAARISELDGLEFIAASDVLPARAEALAADHGGESHASLEALLADERVDAVLNTEKPMALTYGDARRLVELAARRGLCLSAAPATLLGDAQQTAWKLVRDAAVGHVRVAYAEANWGRIERWHPAPLTLHSVGAMIDVGIFRWNGRDERER